MSRTLRETDLLVVESEHFITEGPAVAPPKRRIGCRAITGAALVTGAVVYVTASSAKQPCFVPAAIDGKTVMSLAEAHTREMSDMLHGDHGMIYDWMDKNQDTASDSSESRSLPKEIQQAIDEKDHTKAKKVVEQALDRGLGNWHGKRMDLKSYIKAHRRALKGRPPTPANQATTAECVFNIEQATNQIAALAAEIMDSAKTCVKGIDWLGTSGKSCVVNLGGIGYSVSMIASTLSLAAENCANTIIPNYGALCGGAAFGLGAVASQLASAAALTSAACDPAKLNQPPVPGATPSNYGAPGTPGADARRLHEVVNSTSAEARRLFGGGKASDATQCFVDTSAMAWWLAQAGIAINAAANNKGPGGGSCHLPKLKHGKLLKKAYQYTEMVCTIDALGAVHAFGQVVQYLQLAFAHCPDQLNQQAMCGAGIEGMLSALVGTGPTSLSFYLTCWRAHGWDFKDGMLVRNNVKGKLNQIAMSPHVNGLRQEGNYGRRLSENLAELDELRKKFSSPEEAWKSIGYDMEDPEAAFRQVPRPHIQDKELLSLVEERPSAKAADGTPLPMCS